MKLILFFFVLFFLSCVWGNHGSPIDATGNIVGDKHATNASIVMILVNWGGDIDASTEFSLWRTSTHPKILAELTIEISVSHRAKNSALNQILVSLEEKPNLFTHVLIVNQDISFNYDVIDTLLDANKDFVSAVSVSGKYPFTPNFIPAPEYVKDLPDNINSLDGVYNTLMKSGEPFKADVISSDFLLMKIAKLKTMGKYFSKSYQWFWLSGESEWLGNCYNLYVSKNIPLKPQQLSNYNEITKNLRKSIPEDDLCFCKNAKRFSYPLYVHPQAQVFKKSTVYLTYDIVQKMKENNQIKNSEDSTFVKELQTALGTVAIENRKTEQRNYVYSKPAANAKVVIATAVWDSYKISTLNSLYRLSPHPDIIGRVSVNYKDIQKARNELVRTIESEFSEDFTHILFIDSDMTFKPEDYESLLALDLPLAFGIATKRSSSSSPAYLPLGEDFSDYSHLLSALQVFPPKAFFVKGAGMAFTLIKREVFDKVARINDLGEREWFWTEHVIDEDTHQEVHLSEDYNFCRIASSYGYKLGLQPSVVLGHVSDYPYTLANWLDNLGVNYTKH